MGSSKAKNQSAPPPRSFWRRKSTWIVLVIAVVLLGGGTAAAVARHRHNQAVAADRARFEQTDKDLQALANLIKSQTHPQKSSYQKYCEYADREFAKGPLTCSLYLKNSYGVNVIPLANDITSRYDKTLTSRPSKFQFEKNTILPQSSGLGSAGYFTVIEDDSYETKGSAYHDRLTDMGCGVTYTFFLSDSGPSMLDRIPNYKYSLEASIVCSDTAVSSYYQIK